MHTLTFKRRLRPGCSTGGEGTKVEVRFADPIVDGRSLLDTLLERDANLDVVFGLGWGPDEAQQAQHERLIGRAPADLPNGRVALYVCPECGDLGCGAITAEVVHTGHSVVWQAFGYENNYDAEGPLLAPFEGLGPFEFGATAYAETLRQALAGEDLGAPNASAP